MNSAASKPPSMPCTIECGLGSPERSSAAGFTSSASRLRMNQWLSFSTTLVAPAARAPSTAALASAVMTRRKRPYSGAQAGLLGSVCDSCTTPATPSMSTEMYTRTADSRSEALPHDDGHDLTLPGPVVEIDHDDLLPRPQLQPPVHHRDGEARLEQRRAHVREAVAVAPARVVGVLAARGRDDVERATQIRPRAGPVLDRRHRTGGPGEGDDGDPL